MGEECASCFWSPGCLIKSQLNSFNHVVPSGTFNSMLRFLVQMRENKHKKDGLVLTCLLSHALFDCLGTNSNGRNKGKSHTIES